MSMERVAEVLDMPVQEENDVAKARKLAQGRAAVERYVERLENATERLITGPEASELYCALAELRDGMIEKDGEQVEDLYRKALNAFSLSHDANLGLRRLSRSQGNFEETIASIERELVTAKPERRRELQLELVRTCLYCMKEPKRAIEMLEVLGGDEAGHVDVEATTEVPEMPSGFDAELFLLWEDALVALGDWERYERKLREALGQQKDLGPMTQHIEERLWVLYRYIKPDPEQTRMLCSHLVKMQPLDDELVEDELARAQSAGDMDRVVAILKRAIERLEGSPREAYYRTLLSDIAAYQFEDREHALDVLVDSRNGNDLIMLHQQMMLLADAGNSDALLDVMARCLELVRTPQLKAEQLHTIACVLRDEMDQEDAAVDVLCEANELCPTYEPTIEALADYYSREEMWDRLAQLYEYEISYASGHQLPEYTPEVYMARHFRLAHLYEDQLHYALNAFNHYQAILKYRPDDILALKGASRMAQIAGNWTELLQLYADAEGCTQDLREHVFLLERIAQIADVYMNDADTACTALEALRAIEPARSGTLAALARLYLKLERWEDLISLTNEEIDSVTSSDYKASLLCRNAEIAEKHIGNLNQAIGYYEKARSVSSGCRQAFSELARIYGQQKSWDKLMDLLKNEVDLTADARMKCAYLRRIADILNIEQDCEDDAVPIYENCIKLNERDDISRHFLLNYYRHHEKWEDVLRILDIEKNAGGTLGAQWLTWFWMGRIELYRLNDEKRALASFAKAFELNPDDDTLLRTWLSLSRRVGDPKETRSILETALENVSDDAAKDEIVLALADLELSQTHRPNDIAKSIMGYCTPAKLQKRGVRFLTMVSTAVHSANGEWSSKLALSLQPRQPKEIQSHALMAGIVLDLPDEIRDRLHEVLCQVTDGDLAANLWASISPSLRPDYHKLSDEILASASHEAQNLRRWRVIGSLLAGDVTDPTEDLLPDNRDESMSYRPDLELLAAYFERFENWTKLLEVLNVQEENTLNEEESIQVTLQRAWVLNKINKPEDALVSVRKACQKCAYDNPMRLSLYDYLAKNKDWDFLIDQIRQHLMHSEDRTEKCSLSMRLADIYRNGISNLQESLRWLNNAYHEEPSRGEILCDIANTAQQIDELDIARRALDDYIHVHKPSLEEQFKLEPQLLDLHFNHEGGDTKRMLSYFEELVRKSGRSRDCLIILGRAHAIAGDPQIAAELILDVVPYPFADSDIELWIILADLYLNRLNKQSEGEELLWALFKAYPREEGVFKRLNNLYHAPAERRIMVENLRKSVSESEVIQADSAMVRRYLGFAAQILGSELGLWKEAQELYSQALEASEEPAQDLVKNRAYARCRVPGEARSAYREFCELLANDPFQADIYRAAFDICRRNNARDRERILRQLATVFLSSERDLCLSEADSRPKMMDSRLLSDDMLFAHLTHPLLRPVQVMLHEAMPIISDVLRDLVPKRTNLGGERIRVDSIQSLFSMCAAAFGIGSIKGFNSHDTSPMPVVLEDPEAYWISMETWENMKPEVQRHWAGYASGLLWTGVSKLAYFEPREVWQLLDGCYYLVTNNGITERDAYTIEASERVNSTSVFKRGIRRDIARLINEIGPENIPVSKAPTWLEGLYATADRAGLMFSGSLTASIPAILEAEGWDPNRKDMQYLSARFKLSRRIPELINFALSEDYLELRFHAGLSLQPSKITG